MAGFDICLNHKRYRKSLETSDSKTEQTICDAPIRGVDKELQIIQVKYNDDVEVSPFCVLP